MSDDFDSYGSYECGTSSRRGRKSKWDREFEEKVPSGSFLDWTLGLLILSAFGWLFGTTDKARLRPITRSQQMR